MIKLNLEETKEIAKQEWKDEKMQEHLIKTYDYYRTSDGLVFEVTKPNKLSITKTIWYDDELPVDEIPSASYENFIAENKHNCNRYCFYNEEYKRGTKFYFCRNNNLVFIDCDYYRNGGVYNIVREITKDEMEEILDIFYERRNAYLLRLRKYFERYGKHIQSRGYWVNR